MAVGTETPGPAGVALNPEVNIHRT